MELAGEIWEFTRTELARLFRSGKGLVLLLLFGLVEAAGGTLFALLSKSAFGQILNAAILAMLGAGSDRAMAEHLMSIPVPILFAWGFALLVLPALVLLMGYDQVSGELATRSVRYLAFRSRRASWALGKAAAQLLALAGLTLLADLVVLIFTLISVPNVSAGSAIGWTFALWALSNVYGFAYVGLVTLISTFFRAPFLSLVAGAGALVVLFIARVLTGWIDAIHPLRFLLPGTYSDGLLSSNGSAVAISVAALLAFSVLFLAGAVTSLRLRDL